MGAQEPISPKRRFPVRSVVSLAAAGRQRAVQSIRFHMQSRDWLLEVRAPASMRSCLLHGGHMY
jgi:hypothetical protein